MPTSEVTPVTIRYIHPPHHGHTSQYHGHEWTTHILFVPCQSAVPFLRFRLFQTLTLKLQVQGLGCGVRARSYSRPNILSIGILFISYQSDQQFLRYNYLENDLETSKVKVISEVKDQGHISYPVSHWCFSFSFHINRTNPSWDMAKIVFDLEKTHLKFFKKIS